MIFSSEFGTLSILLPFKEVVLLCPKLEFKSLILSRIFTTDARIVFLTIYPSSFESSHLTLTELLQFVPLFIISNLQALTEFILFFLQLFD